jgi:hypothetical protein
MLDLYFEPSSEIIQILEILLETDNMPIRPLLSSTLPRPQTLSPMKVGHEPMCTLSGFDVAGTHRQNSQNKGGKSNHLQCSDRQAPRLQCRNVCVFMMLDYQTHLGVQPAAQVSVMRRNLPRHTLMRMC